MATTAAAKPSTRSRARAKGTADPAPDPVGESPAPASSEKNVGGRPTNEAKMARVLAAQIRAGGKSCRNSLPLFSQALIEESDELGGAVAAWAETSPRVRKLVESAAGSVALLNLAAALMPLGLVLFLELKCRRMGVDTSQFDYASAKAMLSLLNEQAETSAPAAGD